MKIGILTFHCAYNFGALLQAYALQKTLKDMGHEACIIDYRPSYLAWSRPSVGLRSFITRHPFRLLKRLLRLKNARRYYDNFFRFEKQEFSLAPLDKPISWDTVIVGSDQIWNGRYNGKDPIWFGNLPAGHTTQNLITYAASAGDAGKAELDGIDLAKNCEKFDSILVREKVLGDRLAACGIDSHIVLDPVLMAEESVWTEWKKQHINKKYVLVYQGRQDENVLRIAREIAQQRGCHVVVVDQYENGRNQPYKHVDISPAEFVSYVANAECVVTSSFHGTAVSIVTKTPFYSIRMNDGADGRVSEILKQLGLEDRFIDKEKSVEFSKIDYSEADQKLNVLRDRSKKLLIKSISKC